MTLWPNVALLGGSIGSGELLVILAVALMVFGPHKLPTIARTLGRLLSDLRRSAREFSDELTRATLETSNSVPHEKTDRPPPPAPSSEKPEH